MRGRLGAAGIIWREALEAPPRRQRAGAFLVRLQKGAADRGYDQCRAALV